MNSIEESFPNAKIVDGVTQSTKEILDSVKSSFERNNVTILKLPSKASANDKQIKKWDQVILTKKWQKIAKSINIPYEMEWFVVSHIAKDDEGISINYRLLGSMGGVFEKISWNEGDVIETVVGNMMS